MSNADQTENRNFEQHQNGKERIDAADASTNAFPGGFQAIATAYGDYTKKSFEDTKSFVEKLSGVRSFDKAVEVQTEFAKSAFETPAIRTIEDAMNTRSNRSRPWSGVRPKI